MLTIYGIPNCDTIKKTLDWFNAKGIAYQFHNYKKEGIGSEKLQEWLVQKTESELINRNGTTWKALSDEQKNAINDATSLIDLLQNNTSIIRRPVVEKDGQILAVGFKAQVYENMVF